MGVRGISGDDSRLTGPAVEGALAARQPPPRAEPAEPSAPADRLEQRQQQPSPTREEVRHMSRLLEGILESLNWNIKLRIDENHDRIVTQIVDPENDEIIKQIPPQELLEIMSRLKQLVGVLLDREA